MSARAQSTRPSPRGNARARPSTVNDFGTRSAGSRAHRSNAAAVPSPGAGQKIPAEFLQDGLVVKGLPGLLTMLHDGRYDDRECIAWLFTDLDLPGRPIDALRENRGSEVKRRAQAMAL